jgi:hypothetical protein
VVRTGQTTQQPANVVATEKTTHRTEVFLLLVSLPGMLLVGAVILAKMDVSVGPARISQAELADVTVVTTPQALADRLDARVEDDAVSVRLSSSAFREVVFAFEGPGGDHVSSITMEAARFKTPNAVIDRAREQLDGRLVLVPVAEGAPAEGELTDIMAGGSDVWRFEGPGRATSLAFRSGSYGSGAITVPDTVELRVHDFRVDDWRDQFEALWTVLRYAAFDLGDGLDARQRAIVGLAE